MTTSMTPNEPTENQNAEALQAANAPTIASLVMLAIQRVIKPPLFSLGQVVATSGALDLLDRSAVNASVLLSKHECGDWGDICADDALSNNEALANHSRVLSAYVLGAQKESLWIITEYDRSVTTLLLPGEY